MYVQNVNSTPQFSEEGCPANGNIEHSITLASSETSQVLRMGFCTETIMFPLG